ncbi:hypothetical protein MATL_G00087520 [Megalops atlanticus]|uniref:Uncharacterized protein n=1 Tax=Megalops atlanticus TaxID=7932 RepID=A0A9D3Q8I1_MEGAT|nr:hypothetical protein MATL_G00087520 [Megalops atlanticus]
MSRKVKTGKVRLQTTDGRTAIINNASPMQIYFQHVHENDANANAATIYRVMVSRGVVHVAFAFKCENSSYFLCVENSEVKLRKSEELPAEKKFFFKLELERETAKYVVSVAQPGCYLITEDSLLTIGTNKSPPSSRLFRL